MPTRLGMPTAFHAANRTSFPSELADRIGPRQRPCGILRDVRLTLRKFSYADLVIHQIRSIRGRKTADRGVQRNDGDNVAGRRDHTLTSLNYTYATDLEWTGERRGQMTSPGLPKLEVAAPPEFNGHEGIWTPEHLFVGAISSCFMTTFLAIADLSKLEFVAFAASAEGRLEKVEGIGLQITEVLLRPRLVLRRPEDRDRALRILEKAERNCLISNSATSRVRLEPDIFVEDGADVAHSYPVPA